MSFPTIPSEQFYNRAICTYIYTSICKIQISNWQFCKLNEMLAVFLFLHFSITINTLLGTNSHWVFILAILYDCARQAWKFESQSAG